MTLVEDLWREGWFERTAKALVRGYTEVDWRDIAHDAVIVAMRAEASFTDDAEISEDTPERRRWWVTFRTRNEMKTQIKRTVINKRPYQSQTSLYDVVGEDGITVKDLALVEASHEAVTVNTLAMQATRKDIQQALTKLTPMQRAYVETYMYTAQPVPAARSGTGARRTTVRANARAQLKVRLAHLKDLLTGD